MESTSCLVMAKPKPVPPNLRVSPPSTWRKLSKMSGGSWGQCRCLIPHMHDAAVRRDVDAHLDAAVLGRKLHRVAQKVEHNLRHLQLVHPHLQVVANRLTRTCKPLRPGERLDGPQGLLQDRGQAQLLRVDRHLSRFQLADVQDFVDHAQEVRAAAADDFQVPGRFPGFAR